MSWKESEKSLIDYLKQIPDERNAGGKRHPIVSDDSPIEDCRNAPAFG